MDKLLLAVELGRVVLVWQECLSLVMISQPDPWEGSQQVVRGGGWTLQEITEAGSVEAC